jgi:FKBP12-rapamycin complex-associated protein
MLQRCRIRIPGPGLTKLCDNRKKNAPDEKPIFQCIAMLASALGPNMTKYMHEVLDLMFQWGLTEQLRQALVVIARHIPPLLESIQGKSIPRLVARCLF